MTRTARPTTNRQTGRTAGCTWGAVVPVGLLALLLVTAPGGCASRSGDCDPAHPDFFRATACLAGGGYRERGRALATNLAAERGRHLAFHSVLTALAAEQDALSTQLQARTAAYAQLDAAWDALARDLAATRTANQALAARIAAIDARVQQRKAADAGPDLSARRAVRDDLRRQVALLEQELAVGLYD